MTPWRIVYMGTPDFAVPALKSLLDGPDPVVGVFTQPDRPTGRGMRMRASPVKEVALAHGLALFQPERLKNPEALADLIALTPDLIVVAAYGQILPEAVLALPPQGCINVHASLLPRWRGAAPIHRALLAGDSESGVAIMRMEKGLDTGPILSMESIPLPDGMTGGALHDALAELGARLLLQTIARLKTGEIQARPQPDEGVTYAAKLTNADEPIDFTASAEMARRRILALNPWPGAMARLDGQAVKLLACRLGMGSGTPGTTLALHTDGPEVACGEGSIVITELQPAGKRRMSAGDWLRGRGMRLEGVWE